MSPIEIGLLAIVGFFVWKAYERKKAIHSMEELGGGLPDTDVYGFLQPASGAAARPTVIAKPTGLAGSQMMTAPAFKTNTDLGVGGTDPTTGFISVTGTAGGDKRGAFSSSGPVESSTGIRTVTGSKV